MHGRPRKAPKPEDAAATDAKSQKLRSLQAQFLSYHHNRIYTKEARETSAKLLEINPEHYTAWNYRKLAVEHLVKESESDAESVKSIFDEELRVVESALMQNFKAYGAWHHRKWVLSKGQSSIDKELRLLNRFQKADSRNFHAWNYRRFMAALMGRSLEDELKYTEDLININFSNYSAWHNRSVLLAELLKKDEGLSSQDVLRKEYGFVRDALFTEPDDQSGWFYHLWLLKQTIQTGAPFLVSSWPAHGCDLIVSGNKCLGESGSSLLSGVPFDLKRFPVVLCFSQNVEGVNSSTVNVQATSVTNNDLNWKPLSPKYAQAAHVWVAYLDLSSSSIPCTVEVMVGKCQGIMSSSGLHFSKPIHIMYTLDAKSLEESSERHSNEIISWDEEDFSILESLQKLCPAVFLEVPALEANFESTALSWRIDTVTEEIDHFRELLDIDNYKIGKLTLARLLTAYDAMVSPYANKMDHSEEILKLYSDLIKSDPPHSRFYKDESSLTLLHQLTSRQESLSKRCFSYKSNNLLNHLKPVCLRLNKLSLSRLGSCEKLLWVQMLDLSENELQSIEGLEAMQLLSYLNLRHNKLASFTALEPLRSIKSLKALDISYNEVGSHSIDTKRYSCSSPVSHTEDIAWNLDQDLPDNDGVTNYWEAFMIFKDSNLQQLDIAGNVVADDKFKTFLVKILPALRWLDGEKLP